MNANPGKIWSVPVYLPYLQPPLTAAMVAEAEDKIGRKLPAEYLALLEAQNGGYTPSTATGTGPSVSTNALTPMQSG